MEHSITQHTITQHSITEESITQEAVPNRRGLSGFALKYVALALMTLDHIHYFFEFTGWIPQWFSMLGRLSMPLFLFSVVEGFVHTHDRRKYFLRIYGIAIAMGLMQFAFYRVPALVRPDGFFPMNAAFQNFAILIVILQGLEWCGQKRWGRGLAAVLLPLAWPYLAAMAVMALTGAAPQTATVVGFTANLLHFSILPMHMSIVDGGTYYILIGVLLYLTRKHRVAQAIGLFLSMLLIFGVRLYLLIPEATIGQMFTQYYEWFGGFAAVFILLYNEKRGHGSKGLFYWYYPAHVYVLYALSCGVYALLY